MTLNPTDRRLIVRIAPPGDPTRISLLARIRDASDEPSWNLFVRVYGPFIYGMCRKAGLDEAGAADATQNVFVRVYRSIRAFEYHPERGRFRGWLCRLTRNEV
ncbi:MAG: sigma factor [Isosphaeraceae bacterium]